MGLIKKLLVIVILLALVLFGASFLIPADWVVEESLEIRSTPPRVFPYLNEFKQWPDWTAWAEDNPDIKYSYSGPSAGMNAVQSWDDGKMKGTMKIFESLAPNTLSYTFQIEGFSESKGSFKLETVDGRCVVTWRAWGTSSNPIEKYFMLYFKMKMADEFDRGLTNLRNLVEGINL